MSTTPTKKVINLYCKSTPDMQLGLTTQFWTGAWETTPEDINPELIKLSILESTTKSYASGQCRFFMCPAYFFCPFTEDIMVGVKGRNDKKKVAIDIAPAGGQPNDGFGFADKVDVEFIPGPKSEEV